MSMRSVVALALILGCCAGPAAAEPTLKVGDAAPKLEVKEFIKGEPVKQFEKGKVYVVECWATWCGPCRESIPHLTELQKKYKDVTFIGVAVLEEDQKVVAPFVKEMGDKLGYRVALDAVPEGADRHSGKVVQNWMIASWQFSLPTSFVIDGEGRVAWLGRPKELEEPLKRVVAAKGRASAEKK
jgi:thiol-disulfide isomerase/thioredoxin